MRVLDNPLRGSGLPRGGDRVDEEISVDIDTARALHALCPIAKVTPLASLRTLASDLGIASLHAKDERQRMNMGSFKALGAAYALAKAAVAEGGDPADALAGRTYVCASEGNHGVSLAAGARLFGAAAVIYLSRSVPESFAARLRERGADVLRVGANYEESLAAARVESRKRGWRLLSDSMMEPCSTPARDVMEGYLITGAEAAEQMPHPPTHVFLQAGVGGLAAAGAAMARRTWGASVKIVVVETEAAPTLFASVEAGKPVDAPDPAPATGSHDDRPPAYLALRYLAREADTLVLISEREGEDAAARLDEARIPTTPSGAGGLAGLCGMAEAGMNALIYVSEKADA